MTGTELLEALSFVDPRFVAEADLSATKRNTPWMKILSVAACLCILVLGAYALQQTQYKSAAVPEAAPAAPAATEAAKTEAMAAPREESSAEVPEPPAEEIDVMPSDELQHVPYARLRVVKVLEEGRFEAIAEATQEMEADIQVTVVVDPAKVPGADQEISNDLSVITEDAVFEIYDGAYDAENNLLYVAWLSTQREAE